MSTKIESLELEIQSNSKGAVEGIDALTQSLNKLRSATSGGLGLSAVSKELQSLNKDSSSTKQGVKNLAEALEPLTKLSKSNLSGYITPLKSLPKALEGVNNVDMSRLNSGLTELVTSLKPLSDLSKTNLSGYITSLKKIPEVMSELDKVDMGAFATKMQEVATAMKPLADEMEKVSNGFSAMPTKIQKLLQETNKIPNANKKAAVSFTDVYHAATSVINVLKKLCSTILSLVKKSMDYTENMNLFAVSMGDVKSLKDAMGYAESISEAMGIDTSEWIRSQGVFQTMATGFGVASDRATVMSQNLTQLGYDLSSLYNIDVEKAFLKLKSGLAGELEPLRELGYDLSQAKLEATALKLGITKSVSAMTQAEKAQLRYYAIMTQVTSAHGDFANTITDPANQMRILKTEISKATREIGNAFIPILQTALPYLIATARVIGELGKVLARLTGYKAEDPTERIKENTGTLTDNLSDAQKEAKKLKSYMLGFDELNVLNPGTDSESENASGWVDFDLPTYEFLPEDFQNQIDGIVEKMKEWLGLTGDINTWGEFFDTKLGEILENVGLIGAGLALWKLSSKFTDSLTALTVSIGATLLIDGIKSIVDEGLTWENTIENAVGGFLIGADIGFKLGGWKGMIGGAVIGIGVSLLISGITSMIEEGVDVENVLTTITGLLTAIGGIIAVVKLFNKNHPSPVEDFNKTAKTIGEVSDGTSTLTPKLKNLATNFGLGLVIIAEVCAAALLVTGAIALLGVELEQVGIAWEPVLENGDVVLTAVGLGTAILVAIGVATALLGTLGGAVVGQIAIGIAILAELGAAALLFIAEIWAIGKGLDEIGKAWQPVLDNGDMIATGIGLGTAILVAIGVVAAALGVVAIASVGLLPLAIGLGTLMLVELGVAAIAFITEIVAIGVALGKIGDAWQPVLGTGETIESAISVGTALLVAIGVVAAALGVVAIATVGLLPLAIESGTKMLVDLGVAAVLFIVEIAAIGVALGKIGDAWQPVLNDGETIASAIEVGTRLLTAIGEVTAILGAASIASVGLLPVAVDKGTELLVDLKDSFIVFTDCMGQVATHLSTKLHPVLSAAIGSLPALSENMSKFAEFMSGFAKEVVKYSVDSAIASIAGTIETVIGYFAGDPVTKMRKEVYDQNKEFKTLINDLEKIIPNIQYATTLAAQYNEAMGMFDQTTGANKGLLGNLGIVKSAINNIVAGIETLTNGVINGINGMIKALNALSFSVPDWVPVYGGRKFALNLKTISTISIPRFAEGGFPEQGQLFMAREAGAEMVGSIGRRTAVANNDQIVSGIAGGVAEANEEQNALLREQNSLLRAILEKESGVYLDGKNLTTSVEKYQRERGRVLITGGVL